MLFFSFFKTLVGKTVTVEMKNGIEVTGKLHSVDQFFNVKLEEVQPVKVKSRVFVFFFLNNECL